MGVRTNKVLTQLNISLSSLVEYLNSIPDLKPTKELNVNTKLTDEQFIALLRKFGRHEKPEERKRNARFFKKSQIEKIRAAFKPEEVNLKFIEIGTVSLSKLRFVNHNIIYKWEKDYYLYFDNGISSILQSHKNHPLFKNESCELYFNNQDYTFRFAEKSVLQRLIALSAQLEEHEKLVKKNLELEGQNKHDENIEKKTKITIDNIEFFDGYYQVYLIHHGEKDKIITPLKVMDDYSSLCLRHVSRYFSDRFPKDTIIEYNDEKIIRINPPYILNQYIRILHDNMDIHGDWWEDVQNERKPSLSSCRSTSPIIVKKKLSLRSGYIDNLASMQNDKKLIPVYEINHGNQEDAFIFTVSLPNDRCAVIFENVFVKTSTATEVFITKIENYESCLSMVFDYFTDYTISTKRDSLRRGVNPPSKFYAEKFYSVVHGELETWLIKMNQILERTPHKSNMEFVSGLHIPQDIETRSGHNETAPNNVHNELMRKLYSKLCSEYGTDNVGTEIRIGSKRIDAVVKLYDNYDIYEIKSDPDPFTCVTIALGQICQYAYLYCRDKIGKMVIVGATAASPEVEQYLSWFRKNHSMEVYYMRI